MRFSGLVLVGSYDYRLVALSVFIAILASYAALDLAGRVTFAHGRTRFLWLSGGSVAMGIGIWAMHYIGMLAFRLPVPVQYDWPTVLLSLLSAIFASAIALFVVSRRKMGLFQAATGSIAMGVGIAGMHYIGMAAMRLPAVCHYSPGLVIVSVVLAIVISFVALWLTFHFRGDTTAGSVQKTFSALVMGAAIPLMHYTGMAAASFTPSTLAQQGLAHAVNISFLSGGAISLVTFIVLAVVFLTSLADRRFSVQALELESSEQRYRQIVETALDAFVGMDSNGLIMDWNAQAEKIFGWSRIEAIGQNLSEVIVPERYREAHIRGLRHFLACGEGPVLNRRIEITALHRDGHEFPIELNISVTRKGETHRFAAFIRDITDRKIAEERVQFLAYYDSLTGLPNRTLLLDRLGKAIASAHRSKDRVALLFLDLNRFKIINDSLGHSVGDLFLQDVAQRLKNWSRELDTVARIGGDEFLIVLAGIKDIPDAAVAADRLVKALTTDCVLQGHSLSIDCSIGISIYPDHGTDAETLIKNADAAMYGAKDNGRNTFRFFTDEMNAQVVERLTLEHSLRHALERKELFLMYQPQMEIATGVITGLEALLRWQHPELGLVPPDKFIRVAENCGLIMPIGEWVLRTACFQIRKWHDEGLLAVPVAVNVSAVQFRQEGFAKLVGTVLDETGLPPRFLELELTESLLLSNADVMFSVFQELKAMGVKLAIDDFGTGYSSLSYLKLFPVNKLKIDRSFIRDIIENLDDAAITTAIISMGKSLNLKVIAEGVETEPQLSFLRAHHCDEIQGYYFSKPLSADDVVKKLLGAAVTPYW